MKDKNFSEFEFFFEKYKTEKTPPEVDTRLRNKLEEFRVMLETRKTNNKSNLIFGKQRRTSMKKVGLIIGTAAVFILIVSGIYYNLRSKSPENLYAALFDQFEKSKTMTFTTETEMKGTPVNMKNMQEKFYYKEPGLSRIEMSINMQDKNQKVKTISSYMIIDKINKKTVGIYPRQKKYMKLDFSTEQNNNPNISMITRMKTLPKRADKVIGRQKIDGKELLGFLVNENGMKKEVWVEPSTGKLIQIDMEIVNLSGVKYKVTNIEFDTVLDDSLFSMAIPEGYKPTEPLPYDPKHKATEEDLINFLKDLSFYDKEGRFPPSLNDHKELTNSIRQMEKRMKEMKKDSTELRAKEAVVAYGFHFFMPMKPENDWHYAGKGVKLGTADKPICWWKPDGADKYRVIYGDLKIRDVSPEEIPKFNKN